MNRRYYLLLIILPALLTNAARSQSISYRYGNKSWDPDKLGTQRAVVTVTGDGKVAETVIPWRCRKMTPDQQIIVVEAKSGQQISKVTAKNVSRAEGTIDFEPTSGKGTYYVYFLPYELKKPVNYPNAVYKKMANTASVDWEQSIASSQKADVKINYIESIDSLNSFYPMEVIATPAEEASVIKNAGQNSYMVFPEHRIYPIKMDTILPERWLGKENESTFKDTASRGEHFAYQLGIYAFGKKLDNVKAKFSALKHGSNDVIPISQISCLNTDGISANGRPFQKTVDVEKGHIQAMWCLVNIPATTKTNMYTGTATVTEAGQSAQNVNDSINVDNMVLTDGGVGAPWKQTRLTWLTSPLAQPNTVIAPYVPLKVNQHTISLLGRMLTLKESGFPNSIDTYYTEEMTSIGTTPNHILSQPNKQNVKSSGITQHKQGAKQTKKQTEPGTVT